MKFRVWDNTCECWLENYVIYQYGNVASNSVWLQNDEAVIEQFTGFKDKNGKEIYEGDIIKYNSIDSEIILMVVKSKTEPALCLLNMLYADGNHIIKQEQMFQEYILLEKYSEVTGNIHETK